MDDRVRKAVLAKIDETLSNIGEVIKIQQQLLAHTHVTHKDDFAFGVVIGRIYNSFHYQTRRALKRNATEQEFSEFLDILSKRADELRKAFLEQKKQQ